MHLAQAEGLRRRVGVNGTGSSETTLVRQRNGNGIIIALLRCCRRGGHGIQRPRLALPIRERRDAVEDFGQLHCAVSTSTSPTVFETHHKQALQRVLEGSDIHLVGPSQRRLLRQSKVGLRNVIRAAHPAPRVARLALNDDT